METPTYKHLRGTALAILLAAIAYSLSYATSTLGPVIWGLILGILGGNTLRLSPSFDAGIKFSEKTILAYAIIFMGVATGASLNSGAPVRIALLVIVVMAATIALALLLGRLFGFSKIDGLLIGVGNAVCGASAIAAISGIVNANAKSTGMSIATINILGIAGLFVLPPLLIGSSENVIPNALYTGGTLQALGQAVAAGEAVSPETGLWATTIKLFRVSMLLPIALVIAFTMGRSEGSKPGLKLIPSFLWLFVITAIIGYFEVLPDAVQSGIKVVEKILLTIAMAAIGWQVQFRKLKSEGPKILLFGTLIFILELVLMYTLIQLNPFAIEF